MIRVDLHPRELDLILQALDAMQVLELVRNRRRERPDNLLERVEERLRIALARQTGGAAR